MPNKPRQNGSSRLRLVVETVLGFSLIATASFERPGSGFGAFGYWQSMIGVLLVALSVWNLLRARHISTDR